MNNASIVTSQTSSTSSSEWQKNSAILLFEFQADQWIFDDTYSQLKSYTFVYRTCSIITRGLYILLPHFQCGFKSRAGYVGACMVYTLG